MWANSFMIMNKPIPIDLSAEQVFTLTQRVLETKGLLKVLQEAESREEFEVVLQRFFAYNGQQLLHLEKSITLNYTRPC